jgi:catechol 2,3-dioxygenase-like lactoylglutathione lyase family enzyme
MARRSLAAVTLLVPSYRAGLDFYVGQMGFALIEDRPLGGGRRWVLVAPNAEAETRLLLAQAATPDQTAAIGNQTGGRVFLFLNTPDFAADHARLTAAGVRFAEAPRHEDYCTVAVFEDPFGNRWDLIEPASR